MIKSIEARIFLYTLQRLSSIPTVIGISFVVYWFLTYPIQPSSSEVTGVFLTISPILDRVRDHNTFTSLV
jgi:hypothetical protein